MEVDTHTVDGSTTSEDTDQAEALVEELSRRISRLSDPNPDLTRRVTSIGTTGTSDPNYEVDFESEDDPENPKNWTIKYKAMAMTFLSWNTLTVCVLAQLFSHDHRD